LKALCRSALARATNLDAVLRGSKQRTREPLRCCESSKAAGDICPNELVSGLRPWSWVAAGGNGANGRIPIDESYHQKSKDEGKHGEAAQDNLSGLPIMPGPRAAVVIPACAGVHVGRCRPRQTQFPAAVRALVYVKARVTVGDELNSLDCHFPAALTGGELDGLRFQ